MTFDIAYYLIVACLVAINAIGVSFGQSIMMEGAIQAANKQPFARGNIFRTAYLGMALAETAAVIGLIVAVIMLFFLPQNIPPSTPLSYAFIGIACAMCITGFAAGLFSAFPVRSACQSIARQPSLGSHIFRFLLLNLSVMQTAIIFGLIVALFIVGQVGHATSLRDSVRLFSSGLCLGIGSLGSIGGLAWFAYSACKGFGVNRDSYTRIIPFTLVSQGIIESPLIFSLLISTILLFAIPASSRYHELLDICIFIASACASGIGALVTGINSARIAVSACNQIVANPIHYRILSRVSLYAQGILETAVIYPVIISLALLLS